MGYTGGIGGNKMKEKTRTQTLVLTALMMCMILVMTFIIRIPIPATNGYIHLGDGMIFLSVLLLGWKYGAVAAGVGSALADLWAGYAIYAPVTLVVKFVMAMVVGLFIERVVKTDFTTLRLRVAEIMGMVIGGAFMCGGYYVAESFMYGNWVVPLTGIPMNILQFVVGVVLASALATALYRTPAGKIFQYNIVEGESKG